MLTEVSEIYVETFYGPNVIQINFFQYRALALKFLSIVEVKPKERKKQRERETKYITQ